MRVHLPIKTAMEERQARKRERYMRPIARAASGDCKMSFSFLYHPLLYRLYDTVYWILHCVVIH